MSFLVRSLAPQGVVRPLLSASRLLALPRHDCSTQGDFNSRLKGKTAIVTASTDGIGFQVAKRLAAEGANVVVSSRKEENVQKATDELKELGLSVFGQPCNVARDDERQRLIDKTIETFGHIDIFVSNAGINVAEGSILGCPEKAWDKIFSLNVKNTWQLTQLVVPHMKKKKDGAIVYISTAAAFQGYNTYNIPFANENVPINMGVYSVSKIALHGLSKALAYELSEHNIRVNCVAPGLIKTSFSKFLYGNPEILQKAYEIINLRRLGDPSEVAALVAFLVSNDGSYVNGENIPCTGGITTRI